MLRQSLRLSLRFAILLVLAHLLLAAVILASALPLPARLALLLPVMASLAYYLARDALCLLPDSWEKIALDQDGVTVVTRNGEEINGQVASESLVSPYFVVLSIRVEGRHMPAKRVVFQDALPGDAFRELCVFLRFA